MMKLGKLAAAVVLGSAMTMAGSAGASVITFNFDDRNNTDNNSGTYAREGYTFAPTNFSSSTRCYTDNVLNGNGSCFLEVNNGTPTDLTQDNDDAFDLLSFHINFQGNEPNSMKVSGFFETIVEDVLTTVVKDVTIALGQAYDGSGAFSVYLASDLTQKFVGELTQQDGYFILFNRDYFDGVTKFRWDAVENKQVRIDCVSLSPDGTNISAADLGNCGPTTPPAIPLPAAGWLLLAGVGGLAALRRKKQAA